MNSDDNAFEVDEDKQPPNESAIALVFLWKLVVLVHRACARLWTSLGELITGEARRTRLSLLFAQYGPQCLRVHRIGEFKIIVYVSTTY